jgi:hypothetical protein
MNRISLWGLFVVTVGSSSEIARLPCALKPSMLKSLGGLFRANGTFRSIKNHLVNLLNHKPTWSSAPTLLVLLQDPKEDQGYDEQAAKPNAVGWRFSGLRAQNGS